MITALLLPSLAVAFEGMWLPEQLPALASELEDAGSEIPAERLADVSRGPLAAIVDLDDRCSGAFVSEDGLIATAYHCIGEAMRNASHADENLFETGFYAPTRELERYAGSTFSVKVTLSMEDVTDDVLAGTRKLSGAERQKRLQTHIRALEKRCERPGVHCEVVPFDQGTTYKLIEQRELKDVRVVYSPPRPVGYYGGAADNWQWPRHSGDFAFLRAYADADNQPTAYRRDNRPFRPDAWLDVATTAPEEGEFVMVAGYPSGTYRWKSAAEIDFARDAGYPRKIATLADILDILRRFAESDERTAAIVDPRILSLNNQLQYMQGNLAAFRRIDANKRKWMLERDLAAWIAADPERAARYGELLDEIHRLQAEEASTAARDHVASQLAAHGVMFDTALKLYRLARESTKRDAERARGYQDRDRPAFADKMDAVDQRYAFRVEMEITRYFLDRMLRLPDSARIPELDAWFERQRGETYDARLENAVTRLYTAGADLSDATRRRALMDTSVWYLERSGNPWFELAEAMLPFFERLEAAQTERSARWSRARPLYLEAMREFLPTYEGEHLATNVFYPDANGTLRVTFGRVDGFFPRDGLIAAPRTRLTGILEKAGDAPYDAPLALVSAIEKGVQGPYADGDERVSVNYLSTADTTLGSSGSATVDAQGRFCGVLFDGNYESMATDWMFEESLTRSIHTDVAYILWYLDAVAGADALLRELGKQPAIDSASVRR